MTILLLGFFERSTYTLCSAMQGITCADEGGTKSFLLSQYIIFGGSNWQGSGSVKFKAGLNRSHVSVPGNDLTLVCAKRLYSMRYNALFLSYPML
jgi:hypothetical protein